MSPKDSEDTEDKHGIKDNDKDTSRLLMSALWLEHRNHPMGGIAKLQ